MYACAVVLHETVLRISTDIRFFVRPMVTWRARTIGRLPDFQVREIFHELIQADLVRSLGQIQLDLRDGEWTKAEGVERF